MQVEYELTPKDLYAFQWRAVFESPLGRRSRHSRMNFTFLVVALPIVFVAQWYLETRLMRRAIRRLLADEKPERGQLGKHRILVSEEGVIESTAVGESRPSWAGHCGPPCRIGRSSFDVSVGGERRCRLPGPGARPAREPKITARIHPDWRPDR